MKNVILIPVVAALAVSFAPVSQANVAQNLCEYVSVDDKKRLRSFLKSNKLKIRNIFSGVQCNGENLLAFAASKNAVKTGSMIISKLPKKVVASNKASLGATQELVDAANKRIGA